mmetsp:Transcript_25176/g.58972  ORF Transcript_25176/g.58972 Transcript_25176/m.58972 type:complete len:313 (-) Transcript_25176:724-1662(-)
MSLDNKTEGQNGGSENAATHENKGSLILQVTESKSKANSSGISSSSDNSRDGTGGRWIDVWYNSIRGTFGGLDEKREENHDGDRGSKRLGLSKYQNQSTFHHQAECLGDDASLHSHVFVSSIREETSKTTSKQVHESEDRGNSGSGFGCLAELILEVKSSGIVHGQFNTEAACVLNEKDPGVKVECSLAERSGSGNVSHLSLLLELGVVSFGGIIGNKVDHYSCSECDNCRYNTDPSPCLRGVSIENDLEEREKSSSHNNLCHTSSKVTPSTNQGIRSSDNFLAEHSRRPVLAHNKGTSSGTNEKTENDKTG